MAKSPGHEEPQNARAVLATLPAVPSTVPDF